MRLLQLTVQNVRGLRDLHLQLDGSNIVIWGPNGAGKSGVVDAIDFLFTGRISRLLGEGTAGITLARHGPHIDHGPDSALVAATVELEGFPEPIDLTRCMARPDQLECPDEARASLANTSDLMRRGGVILTRRDILRYVAAEAGKRADEIQQLLHLKSVDNIRASLYRARTQLRRNKDSAQRAIEIAKAEVNVHLSTTEYSDESLLETVNTSRITLDGSALSIPHSTQFKDGVPPPAARDRNSRASNPDFLRQVIQNILQATQPTILPDITAKDHYLRKSIANLIAQPALLTELKRLELTTHAAHFVDNSTVECPVCGASWPVGHLKTHLNARIDTAHVAQAVNTNILEAAEALAGPTRNLQAKLNTLTVSLRDGQIQITNQDLDILHSWLKNLNDFLPALASPVEHYLDAGFSTATVARQFVPDRLDELFARLDTLLDDALPTATPQQTAWDILTRLEESVRALENRTNEHRSSSLYCERSEVLFAAYEEARDLVFDDLYSRIAHRFVEFYRILHDHERNHFNARLQPKGASLTFGVDFLGRGTHPPHALHSEGHQDSMGICLFLALNEELSKGALHLIVLDDVMMSVDTGHRKDVCRLLKEQFLERQFIITTHDRTWAKQLKQERVVEASRVIEFTGWTVERGPHTHQQMDLWATIQAYLDQDDVTEAAFNLRRGSEDFFESICDALGAKITYNSGVQWQLDDWLPAAMEQHRTLLKRARRVASSWADKTAIDELGELESVRKQIYGRTYVEQWAINASVHFNNWENMSREDFLPVVDAFRDLQALFACSICGGLLERVPRKGTLQVVKCPCGLVNWNLQYKSGYS